MDAVLLAKIIFGFIVAVTLCSYLTLIFIPQPKNLINGSKGNAGISKTRSR